MSLLKMSFGDRFHVSREGGAEGDGWVHQMSTNSMAVSGLRFRKSFVGIGFKVVLFSYAQRMN